MIQAVLMTCLGIDQESDAARTGTYEAPERAHAVVRDGVWRTHTRYASAVLFPDRAAETLAVFVAHPEEDQAEQAYKVAQETYDKVRFRSSFPLAFSLSLSLPRRLPSRGPFATIRHLRRAHILIRST